jgi:hypothetical protein
MANQARELTCSPLVYVVSRFVASTTSKQISKGKKNMVHVRKGLI